MLRRRSLSHNNDQAVYLFFRQAASADASSLGRLGRDPTLTSVRSSHEKPSRNLVEAVDLHTCFDRKFRRVIVAKSCREE